MIGLEQLANMVDHTLLKAYVKEEEFLTLCQQADDCGFKMVAVNPAAVAVCAAALKDSPVHVGAAVGFPLGQTTLACKVFETEGVISKGADEIDYVINIVELKNGNFDYIKEEMQRIKDICAKNKVISKVILETCYLTEEEIVKVCEIAKEVKPDFVKTSTGFGTAGATASHVRLMKETVGEEVQVKAAGGIRDLDSALAMVEVGATRLGTSAGIKIVEEYKKRYL